MNTIPAKALILMSTYNGERFLEEQIESILNQEYTHWTLLIRDDGSTDSTLKIVQTYSGKDERIILLVDTLGNLKPAQSFSVLMSHACKRSEPFIFFADQDDVWLPDKLKNQVSQLEKLTRQYSEEKPLLVFSDLHVVDENLKTINSSLLAFEHLYHEKNEALKTLLIHNYIAGCSVGMNKALLQFAYPVPPEAIMHDWWCGLCAASLGKIDFFNRATLLYRQHAKNEKGSKGWANKLRSIFNVRQNVGKKFLELRLSFASRFIQAESLVLRLGKLNKHHSDVDEFCHLPKTNRFRRTINALQQNFQPQGVVRKLGFYLLLLAL